LVAVLGAPKKQESEYDPFIYKTIAKRTLAKRKLEWRPARWKVVYKINPSQKDLPEDTDPHMFGPDVLLAETPAGSIIAACCHVLWARRIRFTQRP
jgi:hypothetical protein